MPPGVVGQIFVQPGLAATGGVYPALNVLQPGLTPHIEILMLNLSPKPFTVKILKFS